MNNFCKSKFNNYKTLTVHCVSISLLFIIQLHSIYFYMHIHLVYFIYEEIGDVENTLKENDSLENIRIGNYKNGKYKKRIKKKKKSENIRKYKKTYI